jgi:hypothetical protein
MKASSIVLLVLLSIVLLYVVIIFHVYVLTPKLNINRESGTILQNISPPLDTSVIIELENRIATEHATVLHQGDQLAAQAEEKQQLLTQHEDDLTTLQTHHARIKTLSSELEMLQQPGHKKDVNSFLLESRNKEVLELKSALEVLQQQQLKQQSDVLIPPPAVITLSRPLPASTPSSTARRPGVIVLGMHRSGTSVIGGLMNKMGLETGGPLIGAAKDNAQGFFERLDVVLQNDYLFRKQDVHYSYNTHKYDTMRGLRDVLANDENSNFFNEGKRALKFLNNENNYPWMLKDPRLCITLRTWLPLLNFIPAILFAYRNPYDVAMSMHTRETERFPIQRGLKLWYIYNKRGIQQSQDLCRVVTSHKKMLTHPQEESAKIFDGLRQCGVDVPHAVSVRDIKLFVDKRLQHGKTASTLDSLCTQKGVDFSTLTPPTTWPTTDAVNLYLYRACIRAFCDIESGAAFSHDYKWDETIVNS